MINSLHRQSERFLTYLEENLSYSPRTIYTYRINLKEALPLVEVSEEDGRMLIDLMPYRLHIQNRSNRTIYKKISIFKSFVAYLQERGMKVVLRNDTAIKVPKTLPKPVTKQYIFEALDLCEMEERIIVLMAYALGLRISEIANLKLESIQNGWVRIKGKGDKIRHLPLIDRLRDQLETYLKEGAGRVYLFEKSGRKMSENQIRYRLQKVFKKIGIKITPHQLRHAFATDLLENGARITDVSALLGHSSLETTQIYTKLSTQMKMKNYRKAHPLCRESDGTIDSD
jgi:integrase/recombinase XerC